jgi:Tfp pilus assembly protein PilE
MRNRDFKNNFCCWSYIQFYQISKHKKNRAFILNLSAYVEQHARLTLSQNVVSADSLKKSVLNSTLRCLKIVMICRIFTITVIRLPTVYTMMTPQSSSVVHCMNGILLQTLWPSYKKYYIRSKCHAFIFNHIEYSFVMCLNINIIAVLSHLSTVIAITIMVATSQRNLDVSAHFYK